MTLIYNHNVCLKQLETDNDLRKLKGDKKALIGEVQLATKWIYLDK